MKKFLLFLFLPLTLLAQPQQGGGPFPSGAGGSNNLSGSFIAKNTGDGTNTHFWGSASNVPAITASNLVVVGPARAIRIGTNFAGGEGYDVVINAPPGAVLPGNAVRFMFFSNNIFGGGLSGQYAHPSGALSGGNGFELGVLSDQNIHFKVNADSAHSGQGYYLFAPGVPPGAQIILGGGTTNSSMLVFDWKGDALNGGANYPVIYARSNNTTSASLEIFNPPQVFGGGVFSGGLRQLRIDTNSTQVASPSGLVVSNGITSPGTIIFSGLMFFGPDNRVKFNSSPNFFAEFGANGAGAYGIKIQNGSGTDLIHLGSTAVTLSQLYMEVLGNSGYQGTNYVTNGVASFATDTAIAIAATGWTNILGKNATVYVTATAVAWTIKNRADATIYTSPTLTATVPVHLQPGWSVNAASGLAGTALPE